MDCFICLQLTSASCVWYRKKGIIQYKKTTNSFSHFHRLDLKTKMCRIEKPAIIRLCISKHTLFTQVFFSRIFCIAQIPKLKQKIPEFSFFSFSPFFRERKSQRLLTLLTFSRSSRKVFMTSFRLIISALIFVNILEFHQNIMCIVQVP